MAKLTEEVNHLSAQVDTACEENEVLRNRLGLSPGDEVDVSHLRHRKNVEIEQLRAVNRELEKQVRTHPQLRSFRQSRMQLALFHGLAVHWMCESDLVATGVVSGQFRCHSTL